MPKSTFRCAKVAARTSAPQRTRLRAAALAAVVLSLLLTACGGGAAGNGDDGKKVVLTTFTVLADVARNVAGDKLTVESITKAGAEIHATSRRRGTSGKRPKPTSSWTTG
nr:zinc ABC transporter substrate-binding protein [Arthrobacter nitrophenolicus]